MSSKATSVSTKPEKEEALVKFRSRKLYLVFYIITVATILLIDTRIPPDIWAEVVIWINAAYVGGNGWDKFVQKREPTPLPAVPVIDDSEGAD